jgi:hypothetical protein
VAVSQITTIRRLVGMQERPFELHEALRFRPKIWWDPVPDWLFPHLDRELVIELARVSLQLERNMLEVQLRGMDEISKVLERQRR